MAKKGILLVNLGTPDSPTPAAVKAYLAEFLSDPYVIQLSRLLWLPLLHGIILPLRSKRVAKSYQAIWSEQGSPLLAYSQRLTNKLADQLGDEYQVELAMRYGNPSLKSGLEKLTDCETIRVIPLFPQFSHTTTTTIIEKVKTLCSAEQLSKVSFIESYADHPAYIDALAEQITHQQTVRGPSQHLLVSFHGIPVSYVRKGDPYLNECKRTVAALTKQLKLEQGSYTLCFQSRFGPSKWLEPYLDKVLNNLVSRSVTSVEVICPGFAVDCLETIEEVNETYRELFEEAGGKRFTYITALNDSDVHANLLVSLAKTEQPQHLIE